MDNAQARLAWRMFADGQQIVDLEGVDPAVAVFAGDPPMAYDAERGELTLIDTGVAPALGGRLLAMPVVAPAEVPALAGRWTDRWRCPAPAPLGPCRGDRVHAAAPGAPFPDRQAAAASYRPGLALALAA